VLSVAVQALLLGMSLSSSAIVARLGALNDALIQSEVMKVGEVAQPTTTMHSQRVAWMWTLVVIAD
jgi:hypothetical protein